MPESPATHPPDDEDRNPPAVEFESRLLELDQKLALFQWSIDQYLWRDVRPGDSAEQETQIRALFGLTDLLRRMREELTSISETYRPFIHDGGAR